VETVAEGPLQPFAATKTVAVPLNVGSHVTRPMEVLMLPAAAGLKLQVKLVASVAEVEYKSVPLPRHRTKVPVGLDGVPTVGVTVTLEFAKGEGPLQPLANTVITAVPAKVGSQVTTPVTALMLPAAEGLIDHT